MLFRLGFERELFFEGLDGLTESVVDLLPDLRELTIFNDGNLDDQQLPGVVVHLSLTEG